jgi:type III restriction enzyme
VVEGYAFALQKNVITADIAAMETLAIEPFIEPTAVFVKPRVGVPTGNTGLGGPGEYVMQDRQAFYESTHLQTIEFEITRQVVYKMVGDQEQAPDPNSNAKLRGMARHQLFPQVLRYVHAYVESKVNFRGVDRREIGQARYLQQIVEHLLAAIQPDDALGEPPLMPLLNRYKPIATTADVDFKTTRPVFMTAFSHINAVAADTATWEQSAAFRLEQAAYQGLVKFYARNDQLNFTIPYEFMGVSYHYEPDFLVRLKNDVTLVLEIKGMLTEQDKAKHEAAKKWVEAVNQWGKLGKWGFHVSRDPQVLGQELRWREAERQK